MGSLDVLFQGNIIEVAQEISDKQLVLKNEIENLSLHVLGVHDRQTFPSSSVRRFIIYAMPGVNFECKCHVRNDTTVSVDMCCCRVIISNLCRVLHNQTKLYCIGNGHSKTFMNRYS